MPGHHVDAGALGDIVAFGDGEAAVNLQMDIGQDHIAGLARLEFMKAQPPRRGQDLGGDRGDLLFVGGPVGEVV